MYFAEVFWAWGSWCFVFVVLDLSALELMYFAVLVQKGFLDGQFSQLQQLQDDSNPEFVVEVVSLFFEDSERLLNDLTMAL